MADSILGVSVGQEVSFAKTITARDVELFAEASGDTQPLHLDDVAAGRTRFQRRIAHGILTAGVISAALGTRLSPHAVVVYTGQTLSFLKPVYPGDTITARLTVKSLDAARRRATLLTECFNQREEKVLTGEAKVFLDTFRE
ncbi:MAG: MaoC family dehydratase [Chloroflexi bacterium]|nr:MaoC family dehydratase [Chloroflexota bacterium]